MAAIKLCAPETTPPGISAAPKSFKTHGSQANVDLACYRFASSVRRSCRIDCCGLLDDARAAAVRAAAAAAAAKVTDVTGTWELNVESPMGSRASDAVFTQTGEALGGKMVSPRGEVPLTGTIKGDAITFGINVNVQGQQPADRLHRHGHRRHDERHGRVRLVRRRQVDRQAEASECVGLSPTRAVGEARPTS